MSGVETGRGRSRSWRRRRRRSRRRRARRSSSGESKDTRIRSSRSSRNARPPVRIRMFGNVTYFLSLCHRELAHSFAACEILRPRKVSRTFAPPAPKGEDLIPWIPVSYRRARLSARSSTFPRLLERASKRGSTSRPRLHGRLARVRPRVPQRPPRWTLVGAWSTPTPARPARSSPRTPRVCLPSRNRGARSRTRPRRLPHSPFPDAPARSRAFEPLEEGFPHPGHAPNAKAPRSSSSLDSPAPSPPCSSRRVKARPPSVSGKGGKGRAAVPVDRHAASLTSAVRVQKATDAFAASQFQSIGMMGFMMYMSGNGVQIFSIMVTLGGIFNPIKAILRSGKPSSVSRTRRRT